MKYTMDVHNKTPQQIDSIVAQIFYDFDLDFSATSPCTWASEKMVIGAFGIGAPYLFVDLYNGALTYHIFH